MNFGGLLFGVAGDGCLCNTNKVAHMAYSSTEIDSAQWDHSLIKILQPSYKGKIRKVKTDNSLKITSAALYKLCASYGWTDPLNKLIVTPQIRRETIEFLREGVGRFFATDGNFDINNYTLYRRISVNQADLNPIKFENKRKWLLFIQEIMNGVGIEASIRYQKPKKYVSQRKNKKLWPYLCFKCSL